MSALQHIPNDDTIVALATAPGVGAIAIVRLSGKDAIDICNKVFRGKDLKDQPSHTIHFGTIRDGETVVDEVLVSLFREPNSYTKENVVEISCHGSNYIVRQIIHLLINHGARLARAGEFTKRAFMNGKFDLAQAEAVADLIASDSEAAHQAALNQMRGGFSIKIRALREQLIHFASMIELELDFSEEDVEFANREDLKQLVHDLQKVISELVSSFELGNAIKNGIPVVIAGKPNVGKSTLLNALLNEEKAIVSDIPGTTRDVIEDEIHIEGVTFRFIDTAGIREATDAIEAIGVERTHARMRQASLIIYLFDLAQETMAGIMADIKKLEDMGIPFIKVGNKLDKADPVLLDQLGFQMKDMTLISASTHEHLEELKSRILEAVHIEKFKTGSTVVTNIRHYESLVNTQKALDDVLLAIGSGVTGDLLALDIRMALHHLGEITGEITTDDLLANIFSRFCIGK
jgi:tRNA modification GTPase